MKTFIEVMTWVADAEEQFGDAAQTCGLLFAQYKAAKAAFPPTPALPTDNVYWLAQSKNALLYLTPRNCVPLVISMDGPKVNEEGVLEEFGAEQILPGVWALSPSLNMPGQFHAFVVLYDVPHPAPWSSRIIMP